MNSHHEKKERWYIIKIIANFVLITLPAKYYNFCNHHRSKICKPHSKMQIIFLDYNLSKNILFFLLHCGLRLYAQAFKLQASTSVIRNKHLYGKRQKDNDIETSEKRRLSQLYLKMFFTGQFLIHTTVFMSAVCKMSKLDSDRSIRSFSLPSVSSFRMHVYMYACFFSCICSHLCVYVIGGGVVCMCPDLQN